ncbi:hypothetical protein BIV57_13805 [Mangrovactinospora gilvigrisea]|uniref:Nudix hydrolase domain-containing protein n=1 Tax=Mangrovactinospora gilvigrisea TaxID=1428644 RepID=A0A1J7CB75_9ACTN|nr:hypothetical protein BIV57_13805 [Mangrovactinospora gilvigrisea]
MGSATTEPVLAAGAVLWRPAPGGGREVAVIHRPKYDDWSLPKGKAEPGEEPPETAAREVEEETGHRVRLGPPLPSVEYPLDCGRLKYVRWWAGRSVDGEFAPNHEVDRMVWLPMDEARDALTHPRDLPVLDALAALPAATVPVALVRRSAEPRRAAALLDLFAAGPGWAWAVLSDGTARAGRAAAALDGSGTTVPADLAETARRLAADGTPTAVVARRRELAALARSLGAEPEIPDAGVTVLHLSGTHLLADEAHAPL